MKSVAVVTLALLATANAFTAPHMATRAIGNPFKKGKKAAPKAAGKAAGKAAAKAAPVSLLIFDCGN